VFPERVHHAPGTVRPGGLTVANFALVRVIVKVLTMKPLPGQVRTTLWIGVVGPPIASLILMMTICVPLLAARAGPIDVSGWIVLFIFFAVPIGYVFGVVPAVLAATVYSRVLTARARRTGTLGRACLAAICGGLVGGIWFFVVAGSDWSDYAAAAALVAALLSLCWPRPPLHSGDRGRTTHFAQTPVGDFPSRGPGRGRSISLARSRQRLAPTTGQFR
jgi:hypothetical protein